MMLALVAVTMVIIWVMPKITRTIPAPLAGIGLVAAVVIAFGLDVPRVGDLASIEGGLPDFHVPMVPLTLGVKVMTSWPPIPLASRMAWRSSASCAA